MPIDLTPQQLTEVRNILQKFISNHEVWAFGSRIRGNAKKHSDLDLALISTQPIPLKTLALLKEAFSDSALPFKVDLVDWSLISEEFKNLIEQEHEQLRA